MKTEKQKLGGWLWEIEWNVDCDQLHYAPSVNSFWNCKVNGARTRRGLKSGFRIRF